MDIPTVSATPVKPVSNVTQKIIVLFTALGLGFTAALLGTLPIILEKSKPAAASSVARFFWPAPFGEQIEFISIGLFFGICLVLLLKWGLHKQFSFTRGLIVVLASTLAYVIAYFATYAAAWANFASNYKP